MTRITGQDLAIDLDGAVDVAQRLLEQLSESELQRHDLGIADRQTNLAAQDVG